MLNDTTMLFQMASEFTDTLANKKKAIQRDEEGQEEVGTPQDD